MKRVQCQACQKSFLIEPDDQAFYEKMQVPPPTWCPRCRMQRRMLFFNERSLFKRTCGLCKKEVISAHRPDAPHPVYCQPCWWSDQWDAMQYARDYDFLRTFFEQFRELRDAVPLPSLNNIYTSNVNSEYCNTCSYVKNCYLCFNSDFSEDCAYTCYLEKSKLCYDIDHAVLSERCYDSMGLFKCYGVKYSADLQECVNVQFSRDLKNCSDCFGCINLRSKQYCIFNTQYSKEEYAQELKKFDLSSFGAIQAMKEKVNAFFQTQPRKYIHDNGMNLNVTGDYLFGCKNVHASYDMVESQDCKYCEFFIIEGSKNCMDVTMWGSNLMDAYECGEVGNNQNNIKFTFECWNESSNLIYSARIMTQNSDLFGCIGLRNKQYCILNKQYTKEAYEEMVPKIIQHMQDMPYKDAVGREYTYGEFFPPEFSLFGYNESFANKYLPLSKGEIASKGYRWSEPEVRDYKIGGDVIECEHRGTCNQQCSTAFKMTPNEKEFYKNLNIPVPTLCSNCRHYERLKLRNPIGLYPRTCGKCGKDIQTSYAPDRPEIIYCETCFNAEIV